MYRTRPTSNFSEKPFSPIRMRSTDTSFETQNPYRRPPLKNPLIASTSTLLSRPGAGHRPPIVGGGVLHESKRDPIGGALRAPPRNASFSPSIDLRASREEDEPMRASSHDLFKNRPMFSKAVIEQVKGGGGGRSPRYSGVASSVELGSNRMNTTMCEVRESHTPLESNRKLQEIIKQKDETIRELSQQLESEVEVKRTGEEGLKREIKEKERAIEELSRRVDEVERGNRFKSESNSLFERERESRVRRMEERLQQ